MTGPLTSHEAAAYDSPPCPHCGGTTIVNWVACPTADQDPDRPDTRQWYPGTYACRDNCSDPAGFPMIDRAEE